MNILIPIALGAIPSLVWLAYYLRKDVHPELKRWIAVVFLLGMAVTPFVVLIQWGLAYFVYEFNLTPFWRDLAIIFLATALVEECFKYLAVRIAIHKNPEFDEPVDAMIYMIVAALGFAAVENILLVSSFAPFSAQMEEALSILILRFAGATFLHALASGALGYYLALSFFYTHKRRRLLLEGLALATLMHGFFNYFIVMYKGQTVYVLVYLIILAIIVAQYFKMLKNSASICEVPIIKK